MSTSQTKNTIPSIKFCSLGEGKYTFELTPSPLGFIGNPEITVELEKTWEKLENYLLRQDTLLAEAVDFNPANTMSTVSIEKVDYLPQVATNCRPDCSSTRAHIRFYPMVVEDSEGKRTYTVDACCSPPLSAPRHPTYRSLIPDLLHLRTQIDASIISRQAARQPSQDDLIKLTLKEDQAGLSWLVHQFTLGYDSGSWESEEPVKCAGFVENDENLSNNAIKVWSATEHIPTSSNVPRTDQSWVEWARHKVSLCGSTVSDKTANSGDIV